MKNSRVFIDRFSSIDHLTKRQLSDDDLVMTALRMTPRVSTFEMSENITVRRAVERLIKKGAIRFNNELGYPWHGISFLKAEGLDAAGEQVRSEAEPVP